MQRQVPRTASGPAHRSRISARNHSSPPLTRLSWSLPQPLTMRLLASRIVGQLIRLVVGLRGRLASTRQSATSGCHHLPAGGMRPRKCRKLKSIVAHTWGLTLLRLQRSFAQHVRLSRRPLRLDLDPAILAGSVAENCSSASPPAWHTDPTSPDCGGFSPTSQRTLHNCARCDRNGAFATTAALAPLVLPA